MNMSKYVLFFNPKIDYNMKSVILDYECEVCFYSGQIKFENGTLKEGIDRTSWCTNCHSNFSIPEEKIWEVINQLNKLRRDLNANENN